MGEAVTTSDKKTEILNLDVSYTDKEKADLTKFYASTFTTSIDNYEVVSGNVVDISDRDVVVGIGFKADGLIPRNEFRDLPNLKPGDQVEVYVEKRENAQGQLVLSRKKAKLFRGWEKIQHAADHGESVEGLVKRRTKGGLIVEIYGIEAFLPGSQIDVKPVRDFDVFVDKMIEVGIVKINNTNDNVVVSHKMLIQKNLETQKADIIANLEKGQVLEGIIKNMTNFGVFIDLGGVDGLLHITDISWGRIGHPEEVLELGQKVKVVVIDFDEEKKRISLGMKQLTPHPWEALPEHIKVGNKVKGKVVNIADYGAFLEIVPGIEGLVHISEISWSQYSRNIKDLIKVGDTIEAVVLTLNCEDKKMSLGTKQLQDDPWEKEGLLEKYAVGTRHIGIVRNIAHFGAFLELEEGIDGLLHVADLSWTHKVSHPADVLQVGEKIEVAILEINKDTKRLSLGRKQLEENPWETYKDTFQEGSVHQCEVMKKVEKGAWVRLANSGLEGFMPKRHLIKENGQEADVQEVLDCKVLSFSSANKKMLLSHTATFSNIPEYKKRPDGEDKKSDTPGGDFVTAEKSTLGDISALADLKERMENE